MGTPVVGSWRDGDDDPLTADGDVQWGGDVSVTVNGAAAAAGASPSTNTPASVTPTAATAAADSSHSSSGKKKATATAAASSMHGSSPSSTSQQPLLLVSSSSPSSSSASPLIDAGPPPALAPAPAPVLLSVPAASRARPRSISRASGSLLQSLSRLGLEWHTTPEANLMYALRAVGGISVKADKTLLIIDTGAIASAAAHDPAHAHAAASAAPTVSAGRLLMVEKEAALKSISFDSLASVTFDAADPSARSLKIVYWFDPKSGTTGRIPGAKQYLLQLSLASRNDSRDVCALLSHVMRHPLPAPPRSLFTNPALPPLPSGLPAPAEFVCLHSGWLEKRGRISWSRRFGRLYPSQRLVIFRNDKSLYPVNVMTLVRGVGETNMVPKAMGKDQIAFEPAPAPGAATAATNASTGAGSASSAPSPLAVASASGSGSNGGPAIPPPAFFMLRFSSTKERDRWYHAFNVDCDQPLKQWIARSKKSGESGDSATTTAAGHTHVVVAGTPESSGGWGPAMATSAAAANASALAAAAAALNSKAGATTGSGGGGGGGKAASSHLAIAIPPRSIQAVGAAGAVGGPSASSIKASASSPRSARATPSSPRSARTPVSAAGKSSQQHHLTLHPSTSAPGSPGGAGSNNSATTISHATTATTASTPTSSTAAVAKPVVLTREAAAAKAAAAAARASAAASSYYLQLMSLLAAPEISRIAPDSEELIIPLNASCGTVSLTQLLKLGLTSPSSKQSQQQQQPQQQQAQEQQQQSTQQQQQPATAGVPSKSLPTTAFSAPSAASSPLLDSSAASSFAPPTPSSAAAVAPAPSPSFNPATHQRISVQGLLRKVTEQQLLFHFYSHFRVHHSQLLVRTSLPSLASFVERTSEKLLMGLGDKKRGQSIQHIDHLLARYHALIATGSHLLQHSKLLLIEGGGTASGSNSTSSQIGFAFPGFDSQVFDIGRFAIVSPGQMVKGLENSFDESEWSSAMKAACVGKELMQSCADFTSLFESGNQKDQDRARTLMHQAQLEVLHNIALAAHMRGKWAGEKVRLREGDLIPWPSVLTQFEVGGAGSLGAPSFQHQSSSSAAQAGWDAERVIEHPLPPEECASAVEYSSASSVSSAGSRPSHGRAQSLNVSSAPFGSSSASSAAAAAVVANDVDLFQYSRNHMQLEQWLELVYIYMPSKSLQEVFLRTRMEEWDREHPDPTAEQHGSANVSLVAAATAAMAAAAAAAAAAESTPAPSPSSTASTSSLSSSASAASSAAPPNAAFVALASSPHTHFLFDPFHYLVFLRLLLSARRLALDALSKSVDRWLDKYPVGHAHRVSAKFSEMTATAKLIEGERRGLVNAMGDLPSPDNMECLLRLKGRLETHQTLQHFLPQRPAANELTKALILPSPVSAGAGGGRLQRKSVIQAHMQSRVAAAAAGAAPGSAAAVASAAAAAAAAAPSSHHTPAQSSVSSIAEGLSEVDDATSTPPSVSTTPALPAFASASSPSPSSSPALPADPSEAAPTRLSVEVESVSGAPILTAALTPNPSASFSEAAAPAVAASDQTDDDDDGAVPPPPSQPHPSASARSAGSVDLDAADLPMRSRAPAHADQVMPGREAPAESVAPPPPPPSQMPPTTLLSSDAILSRNAAESIAPPPPPPALQ